MTWRNLKIRDKVGIGFGTVILLTIISSTILLLNLLRVDKEINLLSNRYIPSVNESSKMDHFWESANGYMSAFDLSGNEHFNKLSERQLQSFIQALNKLIELSDTSNNDLLVRGIDLMQLKKLSSNFKKKKKQYASKEIGINNQLNNINELFNNLNEISSNYQGSFNTQKTLAKANKLHVKLLTHTNTKNAVAISALQKEVNQLESTGGLPREVKNTLNQITASINSFIPGYVDVRFLELKKYEIAKKLMWEVRKSADIGLDYLLEMGDKSAKIVQQEKQILIASIVVVIIFGFGLSYFLATSISRPLVYGISLAEKVAQGDLNVSFASDSKDEVGRLAAALDIMVGNIKKVIDEIKGGTKKMIEASKKLTKESIELNEGANEQASATEEVSSSMEEMYANIQQNTDNSKLTEQIALNAVEGIKVSNNSSKEAKSYLEAITEKISIIGDIAFQTNILALNAAVEAARAGQEGRGFAVVAAEVRKLAERSQHAAGEINIASQNTMESSNNAYNNLHEITPEIEKTANLVQEITSASLEQLSGVEQINNALQQLNQVTQRNASNSEEIGTAAHELEQLSAMLNESISVFSEDKIISTTKNIDTQTKSSNEKEKIEPKIKTKKTVQIKDKPVIDLGKEFDGDDYESY